MRFSELSPKQAVTLLALLLSIPLHVLAGDPPLCCIGSCPDDDGGNSALTLDGATADKSPGIGVEFEAGRVTFQSKGDCAKSDIDLSKGKLVDQRQGSENPPHWMLTADTTLSIDGLLTAEYILSGVEIKIGSGDAAKAADAVGKDIMAWNPSTDKTDDVTIKDSKCNPWKIAGPDPDVKPETIGWAMQVTAPMPLEAISDLFGKAVANPFQPSELLPTTFPDRNMVSVSKDFFQSTPNGISKDSVDPQVLGFFSLVLSYAKGARTESEDTSPKEIHSIMPRTEFITIFDQVKDKVSLKPNSLYQLVKILACHKNGATELDSDYCTGSVQSPVPIDSKMDGQLFTVTPAGQPAQSLKVLDWIQSIQDGTQGKNTDKLTLLDRALDSSIGGLNDGFTLENVLDSNPARPVPLFEFRRLKAAKSPDMSTRVTKAEEAIIKYHKPGGSARFVKKRAHGKYAHVKRQACPTAVAPATTSAAPPPPPPPATSSVAPAGPDIDACDVSYKFFYDQFEIRGKNFDPAKFGDNGDGLKKNVGGCGAITKWNFQLTPSDPTYAWFASGELPIGVKNCVGNAVVSAGGANTGNCHGAG